MRALSARRIATSALCATFLLGVIAPTTLAADTARESTRQSAPADDPATLQSQVQRLGAISSVVAPVTELQNAVLKAENSPLSAAEVTKLGDAAKAAIAAAAANPVTPAVPSTPSTPGVTTPTAPLAPVTPADPATSAQLPADGLQDALAALQQAVTDLVAAATSGDIEDAVDAVETVSEKLVAAVLALLGGLPGLPIPGLSLEQSS
ncbi:hypothetical protein ACFYO0_05975 [Streptomyces sp. NPDC006365]|uniref:hypothetical protein n=1 Tax=Streptomyces sp. NPDC006365 TaxID=3364744 RepID=UPI00369487C8